ncbi:MAG: ferrous iron transport protein A [Turneriella sp.]|nr:ferrous iron transport protein A [Turneriella sp.]
MQRNKKPARKAPKKNAQKIVPRINGRPLSELKPGEAATIVKAPQSNQRLAEIGFVAGERVSLVKVAPFGDPVVVQVLDTPVIIRRAELAEVWVD